MRFLFVALALLLAACTSQAGDQKVGDSTDQFLSSAEVETLLSGNTLTGTTSQGGKFWALYREDGSTRLVVGSDFEDTGTWRIESGGRMCSKWGTRSIGGCFDHFALQGDTVTFSRVDRTQNFTNTVEQGNSHGL